MSLFDLRSLDGEDIDLVVRAVPCPSRHRSRSRRSDSCHKPRKCRRDVRACSMEAIGTQLDRVWSEWCAEHSAIRAAPNMTTAPMLVDWLEFGIKDEEELARLLRDTAILGLKMPN